MPDRIFCPTCNDYVDTKIVEVRRTYTVRGEDIEVDDKDTLCRLCGEVLFNYDIDSEILERVNNIYRERHKLLTPDMVKDIRETYGLTQQEFSKVLGFGDLTISRYENGAIPDTANDNLIRLCENPKNILSLIKNRFEENPTFFKPIKEQLSNFIESIPSIYDIAKYILYRMYKRGGLITNKKLQKLCYYFWCYAIRHTNKYLIIEFEAWAHGPVNPELYHKYNSFGSSEIPVTDKDIFDMESVINKFTQKDIEVFDKVITKLGKLSAEELSERTHRERPWQEANRGRGFSKDVISYATAREFYQD